MLELVIFDCDGVLVDSERIGISIFHKHLESLGVTMSLQEAIEIFKGRSEKDCTAVIETLTGNPLSPDFFPRCLTETFARFERELQPIPGIIPALKTIQQKICVASSGTHEKMAVTLRVTGLLPFFAGRIFSATQVAKGKPHPDLFLFAARSMGIAPENCLVVEDSVPGIKAARTAGMSAIGYADLTEAKDLKNAGAHRVITDMEQLSPLLSHFREIHAPIGP